MKFVVKEDGTIEDVRVQRGILGCLECDEEALRLVKIMPTWIPGKMKEKNVSSYHYLYIDFNSK